MPKKKLKRKRRPTRLPEKWSLAEILQSRKTPLTTNLGAPLKMDDVMVARLYTAASLVISHREMARTVGVDSSTLTRWKNEFPVLRLRVEEKKAQRKCKLMEMEWYDAIDKKCPVSRRFLLTRIHPDIASKPPDDDVDDIIENEEDDDLDLTYL